MTDDILQEREKTHGDFARTAETAQQLKTVLHSAAAVRAIPDVQAEALHMICSKLARIVCGDPNEPDHWRDIAGYARLGERACAPTEGASVPQGSPELSREERGLLPPAGMHVCYHPRTSDDAEPWEGSRNNSGKLEPDVRAATREGVIEQLRGMLK